MKLVASVGNGAGSQLHGGLGLNWCAHFQPGFRHRVCVRSRITSSDEPSSGSSTITSLSDLLVFESAMESSPPPALEPLPIPDSSSIEPEKALPTATSSPWDVVRSSSLTQSDARLLPNQQDNYIASPSSASASSLPSVSRPAGPTTASRPSAARKTRRQRLLSDDEPASPLPLPDSTTQPLESSSPSLSSSTDSQLSNLSFLQSLPSIASLADTDTDTSTPGAFSFTSLPTVDPETSTKSQPVTSEPHSSSGSSSPASAPPAPSSPPGGRKPGRVIRSSSNSRNRMAATWDIASGPTMAPAAGTGVGGLPVTPAQQDAVANAPAWAQALFGASDNPPEPQLQRAALPASAATEPAVQFLERDLPMQGFLELRSQEEEELLAARAKALPPLQSLMDITTAHQPPTRSLEAQVADATETATATATATAPVGRQLPIGKGQLADGTMYEKLSGEDFGPNGYWKRWTTLKGLTLDGTVSWEESWWEASDWAGYKELGAHKTGTTATGAAWKEEWSEKAYHDKETVELTIERTAHKWARAGGDSNNEWEEKWGETHKALGRVNKYADKWARDGENVWHEKWGEDYDGHGGCLKYTDKWAERELWGGAKEQWGDKWTEQFADGRGSKHGEVWSIGADGHRYNRWWNEGHQGDRQVRKWGNSTAGEYWDTMEEMDTYYNPIPHFGFALAVRHSPGLMKVPDLPRGRRPPSPSDDNKGNIDVSDGDGTSGPSSQATAVEEDQDSQALGQGLGALDWGHEPVYTTPKLASTSTSTTTASDPVPQQAITPDPLAGGGAVAAAVTNALDWGEVLRSVKSKVEKSDASPLDTASDGPGSARTSRPQASTAPGAPAGQQNASPTTVVPSMDFNTSAGRGLGGRAVPRTRTVRVQAPPRPKLKSGVADGAKPPSQTRSSSPGAPTLDGGLEKF